MKIPKSVKIGGQNYKVELVNGLADCGSTNFDKQIILINKDQTENRQLSALYHEIIEIWNEAGDLDLRHQTIQTLESFMYQTLRENNIC